MVFEWSFCLYCAKCCFNTEMILLKEDIERLESLGYDRTFFAEFRDGFWRLRNVDGHCVFLDPDTRRCRIYEHRPLGCRLYPLIIVEGIGAVLDPECPMIEAATVNEVEEGLKLLQIFASKLEEDYGYRVRLRIESARQVIDRSLALKRVYSDRRHRQRFL